MRNFIIFFDEKEGTSALVRLLDQFERISVLRSRSQDNSCIFEPFDRHGCGPMSLRDLERCLTLVFTRAPMDTAELHRLYAKTSRSPLQPFKYATARGFKMQFVPPWPDPRKLPVTPPLNLVARLLERYRHWAFSRMMMRLLQRQEVAVIIAVRQDLLRWALSKYHGDGTGNPGHLQFRMARGEIRPEDLGKLKVDIARLAEILSVCEETHARKRRLAQRLRAAGIDVRWYRYEEFLDARESCIRGILDFIDVQVSDEELGRALSQEQRLKKVHPHDYAEFVENHEEVAAHFGERFATWSQAT